MAKWRADGLEIIDRLMQIVRAGHAHRLELVGEQQIHARADHLQQSGLEELDHVGVRQRDGGLDARRLGDPLGLDRSRARRVGCDQIAFGIEPVRIAQCLLDQLLGREVAAHAQEGAHGAVAVRRHQHHAAPGVALILLGVVIGVHAALDQILHIEVSQLVVGDLAGIEALPAELAEGDDGVGRRAARAALMMVRSRRCCMMLSCWPRRPGS
jgi:hypothetical protein